MTDIPTDPAARAAWLDGLERIEQAATKLPWWNDGVTIFLGNGSDTWGLGFPAIATGLADYEDEDGRSDEQQEADACFVVAARTALPALIALVREQAETIEAKEDAQSHRDPEELKQWLDGLEQTVMVASNRRAHGEWAIASEDLIKSVPVLIALVREQEEVIRSQKQELDDARWRLMPKW